MKGLIIKDFICLKKNFKMFVFVTLGIIILSVMYVISFKSGNVAQLLENWNNEDSMGKDTFLKLNRLAISLVLIIPMAFIANVVDCFKEDRKAGFNNSLLSMPVSNMEIAGARYIAMLLYVILGFVCSAIAGVCVSVASEDFVFRDLFSVVLMFGGILIIYMSIVMPCLYLWGSKRADIICSAPFILSVIGVVLVFGRKINSMSDNEAEAGLAKMIESFTCFITTKGFVFMGIAIVCITAAYFISVKIIKYNRGINI